MCTNLELDMHWCAETMVQKITNWRQYIYTSLDLYRRIATIQSTYQLCIKQFKASLTVKSINFLFYHFVLCCIFVGSTRI